jgi:hypothetical protein
MTGPSRLADADRPARAAPAYTFGVLAIPMLVPGTVASPHDQLAVESKRIQTFFTAPVNSADACWRQWRGMAVPICAHFPPRKVDRPVE